MRIRVPATVRALVVVESLWTLAQYVVVAVPALGAPVVLLMATDASTAITVVLAVVGALGVAVHVRFNSIVEARMEKIADRRIFRDRALRRWREQRRAEDADK